MRRLALLILAACSSAKPNDLHVEPEADAAPDTERETVVVHAAFDLPRNELTRTLSAITTDGSRYYALPDRTPQLTVLTPDAEARTFSVSAGVPLQDTPTPSWDGEGLARVGDGSFYAVMVETEPSMAHFDADGRLLEEVVLPEKFAEQSGGNKGLESLTLAPSERYLFTCNETALLRDGKPPSKTQGAVVRILRLDRQGGAPAEFAYRTEPLGAGTGGDMGVSELLALSDERLLVLERGYQADFGSTVRVFQVDLAGQTDVSAVASLADQAPIVNKTLLVDIGALPPGDVTHPGTQPNPLLDNYEGMTLGPLLPDGRRALLLLSDDNRQSSQVARVLVLGWRQ